MIDPNGKAWRVMIHRQGIKMECIVKTETEAKEIERMMKEDTIVDLRAYRYCFGEKIFIIRKPNTSPHLGFRRASYN
jgi:hypothetical protein